MPLELLNDIIITYPSKALNHIYQSPHRNSPELVTELGMFYHI